MELEAANYVAKSNDNDSSLLRSNSLNESHNSHDKCKKFFQVNEEASEEEDDSVFENESNKEIEGAQSDAEDIDGEKFHECSSELDENMSETSHKKGNEGGDTDAETPAGEDISKSNNMFKMKNTKGGMVYD